MSRHALIPFHGMLAFTFLAGFALSAVGATNARVSESYGKLALQFEANRGQTDKDVHFLSRGPGYSLYLTAGEAVLVLYKPNPDAKRDARSTQAQRGAKAQEKSVALRMSLVGAARQPLVSALEEQAGKANYFIGKDPAKWRTNIPTYGKVHYREVYPGIDLVYYGNQRQLEYDFVVAPGTDPKKIVLGFKGSDKLEIDAEGNLVLHTAGGDIRQHKPVIYQEIDGVRREIDGHYAIKPGKRVGFQVAAYDTSRPLVIDPVLSYSTYLGDSGFSDMRSSIAVDRDGNAYVAGVTNSRDFPTTAGAFQPSNGDCCSSGSDVFVTKLNPTGTGLVYSTYLGGINFDLIGGIAVDTDGNAYLTGNTNSPNFPTTPGAFGTSLNGGGTNSSTDAFVTKLNATGSALVYSTYLGGSGAETGDAIAIDKDGSAYVAGGTRSTNFPTTPGAFQRTFAGNPQDGSTDAFVTKLDPTGSFVAYSTYLGGTNIEGVGGITADADGNAYVTGSTVSTNFPTTPGAFQLAHGPGTFTAYVTKLNPSGSALVYSTYLGGTRRDEGTAIAIDRGGSAYVTGSTESSDFPTTAGAFQTTFKGPSGFFGCCDAFVTKLNSSGSALVYSTYLGGSTGDVGNAIAIDSGGSAYVTGFTSSLDFPTTPGAFQTTHAGSGNDVFVTKLDPTGSALIYSTYLGGSSHDEGSAIAIDNGGSAYVTGTTQSTNFPTTPGAFQLTGGGSRTSSFVTRIPGIALLVIDKDGIDNGEAPNFFSPNQVNDDVAAVGVRAQLRFFRDHVGQTITLPVGDVGDEGWFALKTIPASWAQAGGAAGYVGNPAANPEDPAPQGTGPGLGAPDANGDPVSLLKNVPDVTPLRATALNNLIGREVCAVVYDNQVGINQGMRTGDLRGANLGTVAFQVVALTPSTDASSSSLPSVQLRIRDARTMCRGPFALLTDAEAPAGAP